jgi:uncharacterized protein YbjT (DUF2867 family)
MARRRLEVATPDIGRTAALALVEGLPRGKKQVIELAGPVEASGNDVQAALRTITGKDINVVAGPLDAVVSTFTGFGISKEVAELFRELYAGVISGASTSRAATRASCAGRSPSSRRCAG